MPDSLSLPVCTVPFAATSDSQHRSARYGRTFSSALDSRVVPGVHPAAAQESFQERRCQDPRRRHRRSTQFDYYCKRTSWDPAVYLSINYSFTTFRIPTIRELYHRSHASRLLVTNRDLVHTTARFYEIPSTAWQLYWLSCKLVKYQPHKYIVYILYWVLRGPSESKDGGVSVTNVRVSEYPLIAGKPN
jgi:hypothetical protein